MVIERPRQNSISFVHEYYKGTIDSIRFEKFLEKSEELDYIADDIERMVKDEGVLPHQIVVITLDNQNMKGIYSYLQQKLFFKGIASIIPGITVDRDAFGTEGSVTLSTVYKAKGNEAFIVYVIGFEAMYDYVNGIEMRNRVFTSISRSKGWVVLTGIGNQMDRAILEINLLLQDIRQTEGNPKFIFSYPSEENILRKLSAEEHARRLQNAKIGNQTINNVLKLDDEFLKSLPENVLQQLKNKLDI